MGIIKHIRLCDYALSKTSPSQKKDTIAENVFWLLTDYEIHMKLLLAY
jgi:hypothetical protein